MSPRLQIDLKKLRYNLQALRTLESSRGATVFYSLDDVGTHPVILDRYLKEGIVNFATAKVDSLALLRRYGRSVLYNNQPTLSNMRQVVEYADCSYHTEQASLCLASDIALSANRRHGVILLIEAGDLGLGCAAEQIQSLLELCLSLRGVELLGIGYASNRFAGILPEQSVVDNLQLLAEWVQQNYGVEIPAVLIDGPEYISSAFGNCERDLSHIGQLVVGSEIFSGRDVSSSQSLTGLDSDLITVVAEIMENKRVNSTYNADLASSCTPARLITDETFVERGMIRRLTLDLNLCHCNFEHISVYRDELKFLGATTDYSVFETGNSMHDYAVGKDVTFKVDPQGIYQLFNFANLAVDLV